MTKPVLTRLLSVFVVVIALSPAPGFAVNPGEMLENPAQEERAREVSKYLRCVVCQNQSIDDSDAELARDMRVLVRDRILAGDSNQEVLDYMVSRYGNFVLLKPPFEASTYALWIGPAVIFVLGIIALMIFMRQRRPANTTGNSNGVAPLSDDEQKRLNDLMDKDD